MRFTLSQIQSIIQQSLAGNTAQDIVIDTLLTDSRSLSTPESTIFFALTTAHGTGTKYIRPLYEKGVRVFATDTLEGLSLSDIPEAAVLVGGALDALQRIGAWNRNSNTPLKVVGITGSNGKTVVKEWLYQLIGNRQRTVRSPKSYNSQIGVPLSLALIRPDTRLALIEAGISQPGEMERLERIIRPDIAVITNIGSAHQKNFNSLLEKAQEKLILARNARYVVYPADSEVMQEVVSIAGFPKERLMGWSLTDSAAPLYVSSIQSDDFHTDITYHLFNGTTGTYRIPFIDAASIENSITCMATAVVMGYDASNVADKMASLEPVAMRLEVKEGQRGLTLINDSYNSDINSLSIALDFMSRRQAGPAANMQVRSSATEGNMPSPAVSDRGNVPSAAAGGVQKQIVILSDILQSGEDHAELYMQVNQMLEEHGVDRLIAVGTQIERYMSLFHLEYAHFRTTDELIHSSVLEGLHDAIVLIKGARAFNFDNITALLEKRVHETILEVNLQAVVDNLNHYRAMLHNGEKIVCMVKASAYGAGSIEVSKTLQEHNVDYLAVAVADEGVALRQAGITSHIMIMNPEMTSFHDLFEYQLEPEVYNFSILNALIRAANREGVTRFPIHLKLDTGMHRLGFNPVSDIDALIAALQGQQALAPASVFSHFVGSDGSEFDDFTRQQFTLFDQASRKIQAAFPHKILRHICNTAGIERFPQYHLDMVRLGIGLYGIDPFTNGVINTISTLKTTILQIRDVPATDTVGYSRRGVLTRPSKIAAIPIGYADGLNRHLGRGVGYCLVNGQKAHYVGNICMDVAMIDVTDIDCKEGDQVEIFGDHLPVTVLSDLLDTIPYEILTGVSERVKRVYYQQ